MMKKITRIAALLAATAFLLAGFPACSDDDDDDDPTLTAVEIAVADDAITEYKVGEDFDPTGITVTAKYSDGSTKDVTAKADFKATTGDDEEFTTEEAGTFNVTLTATYEGKTATKTCEITVKPVIAPGQDIGGSGGSGSGTGEGDGGSGSGGEAGDEDLTVTGIKIDIDEAALKTEYTVNEKFATTGIKVTATLSDGTSEDVTAKTDFKATTDDGEEFTTAAAGIFEVTLTATYGGKTATKTCEITVKDKGSGTGQGGGGDEGGNAASAKTYNFVGLDSKAVFKNASGESVTVSISKNKGSLPITVTAIAVSDTDSVNVASASEGKFQFETTEDTGGTLTSVNYNSCSLSSNNIPTDLTTTETSKLVNVLSFEVDGAGTINLTAKVGNSTTAADADACIAALYDGDGKLIAKTDSILAKDGGDANLEGSVSGATTVYIAFFRSAGKGSLKVTKIEVSQ